MRFKRILGTIRRKLIPGRVIFTLTSTSFFFLYTVDGNWSDWNPWSSCPVTCGGGLETRIRTCTNPPPAFGGQSCPGAGEESRPCNEVPCPGNMTVRKMLRSSSFPYSLFRCQTWDKVFCPYIVIFCEISIFIFFQEGTVTNPAI